MAEEKIYILNIDTAGSEKRLGEVADELNENNKRIKELQAEQKKKGELDKAQITELARLRGEQRKLGVEQKNLINLTRENAQGNRELDESTNGLRARLNLATAAFDKLTKEQQDNSKAGRQLKGEITQLQASIKGTEEGTGRFQRSVGNYAGSIREALAGTKAFGGAFGSLNKIMSMNPIFLVVTALASLGSGIAKAQFIVDAFQKAWQPLNAVIQSTVGLFQNAVKMIREGTFSLRGFAEEARNTFSQALESGKQLAQLRIDIENQQIRLVQREVDLRNEFEKQRAIAADVNKSNEERTKASQAAIKAIEDLNREQAKLLDLQIAEASLKASLNDTDRAAQLELNRLMAQRKQLQGDFLRETSRVRNQMNSIAKQQSDANKRQAEEQKKLTAEQLAAQTKAEELAAKERADMAKAELSENQKAIQQAFKDQEADRKEQLARELAEVAGNAEAEKNLRQQAADDIASIQATHIQRQIDELNDYADTVEGIDLQIAEKQRELDELLRNERIRGFEEEYKAKKELADQALKDSEARAKLQQQAFIQASQSIGQTVEASISEFEGDFSEFQRKLARSILTTTLEVIQKQLIAKQVAALAEVAIESAANPIQGLLVGGLKIAGIQAAFAAGKLAINKALQFAGGGVIPSGYELPYSTNRGDNTPILAKAGEMVLNDSQQSRIAAMAGADVFARAGVPGTKSGAFADGGVVAPPLNFNADIISALRSLTLQVSVVDINSAQKRVAVREGSRTF